MQSFNKIHLAAILVNGPESFLQRRDNGEKPRWLMVAIFVDGREKIQACTTRRLHQGNILDKFRKNLTKGLGEDAIARL